MNDWSSDMAKLLGLVETTWMGVNAAQAAQSKAMKDKERERETAGAVAA